MGVMETFVPEEGARADAPASAAAFDDAFDASDGALTAQSVETLDRDGTRLRDWPPAIAQRYREEVTARLMRENNFLLLLLLLVALATVGIDLLLAPGVALEGTLLRLLAIAPITLAGLIASARGWTRVGEFCIGASFVAFVAVVLHIGLHLPPEGFARYSSGTILIIGIGNLILPYTMRGLVLCDLAALAAATSVLAMEGTETLVSQFDTLAVIVIASGATLPVAARFEKLRQSNFLLTLRTRLTGEELAEANAALTALAETDALTGIANRRSFERRFDSEVITADEQSLTTDAIALMMIDLDHFKAFNDLHGHQAGDMCLQRVARSLADLFDEAGGVVARYGGEEFIAALRTRDTETAEDLAEEARVTIATTLAPMRGSDRALVTASIGLAVAPVSARLPREELIEMADAALYAGKDGGRNRVEVVEAEAAFA